MCVVSLSVLAIMVLLFLFGDSLPDAMSASAVGNVPGAKPLLTLPVK